MQINKMLLVVSFALLAGCANKPAKQDAAKMPQKKEEASKAAKVESAGTIVGKPAKGSKFAKIKPGMTKKEVEAKIGKPNNEWQRPTGKASIPFYFGDDRWVMEATYKKEGKLTFNSGGDQVLTEVVVNPAEE